MERKKRILYVITKSNFGGAQKYVFDLATNLDSNFEVVVALGGNGALKTKLEEKNIRIIEIKGLGRNVSLFKDVKVFFELLKIYREERPDVIHLNSSKIGGIGSLAALIHKLKTSNLPAQAGFKLQTVFTIHGFAFNEDRNFVQKILIKSIYLLTIILCHKTIVVSNALKNQIQKWPFIQKKIFVVHNGIKEMDFLEKEEARNFFCEKIPLLKNLPTDTFWLGTISELHSIKGHKYILEALSNLQNKNFVFLIIGEGEERENLTKMIKEKGLENKVFLAGHIDNAPKYLKALDIFTLTSLSEALGYVILEAGLAELPVIATNVGGIPEIIENKKTGLLISPKNSSEIAKALNELMSDVNLRNILSENLQKKVVNNFSIQGMIKATELIYK